MVARVVKILTAIAAVAAIGFAIYHFRLWEKDWSTIDDGWASLIGSAVGSFLAVVGALYVSKSEDRRKKKEFEEFVCVSVQAIALQASCLEAIAREPQKIAQTQHDSASIISLQTRNLVDAIAVFEREIAGSQDGAYHLRRSIVAFDTMLKEAKRYLSLDFDISIACQHWHVGAYQTRQHATMFLETFNWVVPTPPPEYFKGEVNSLFATWRVYNFPNPSNTVSSNPIHDASDELRRRAMT